MATHVTASIFIHAAPSVRASETTGFPCILLCDKKDDADVSIHFMGGYGGEGTDSEEQALEWLRQTTEAVHLAIANSKRGGQDEPLP